MCIFQHLLLAIKLIFFSLFLLKWTTSLVRPLYWFISFIGEIKSFFETESRYVKVILWRNDMKFRHFLYEEFFLHKYIQLEGPYWRITFHLLPKWGLKVNLVGKSPLKDHRLFIILLISTLLFHAFLYLPPKDGIKRKNWIFPTVLSSCFFCKAWRKKWNK